MGNESINRRHLAKGAIWSVPVVAVVSAAPATAASPSPQLEVSGRGTWNLSWNSSRVDGYRSFKLFSTVPGGTAPGPGFCVTNSTTATQISNASVTYYLPDSSLNFSASDGPGFNGWSRLTRDISKGTKYFDGDTYYPYTSVYTGGITAKNGTTCFPVFGFESDDYVSSTGYFFADHSVLLNGKATSANFGPVEMFD